MARLRPPSGNEAGILSRQGELFNGGAAEGFLQKFHPGSRMIMLLIILGGISVCDNPVILAGFFALAMATAVAAFLNLRSIFRIMLVPLLLMAIPSWFVAVLYYQIPVLSGVPFFLRTLASMSVASVLLHSIGLRRIGEVFAWLRVPVELRQTWTMMVSQVAGFSDLVNEMALARHARRVQPVGGSVVRRQIGGQIGILLARTYQRGNQLGLAMESRQITHEGRVTSMGDVRAWTGKDYALIILGVAMASLGVII